MLVSFENAKPLTTRRHAVLLLSFYKTVPMHPASGEFTEWNPSCSYNNVYAYRTTIIDRGIAFVCIYRTCEIFNLEK